MRVSLAALEELRVKYAQMLAMRVAHASGDDDAEEARARMAEVASRFPGCLREIDDLELTEIRRRIQALDEVVQARCELEPWMEAIALFHAMARGALCAKRWLGGRKRVGVEVEEAFERDLSSLLFPEDARGWSGQLARIASPPRGRVMDVVFARLARELGTSERAARRLVFGLPRRERRGS
ncbi:MAG TPA: hypothetical protein VGL81_33760 [Polyangiaceae bacterium]